MKTKVIVGFPGVGKKHMELNYDKKVILAEDFDMVTGGIGTCDYVLCHPHVIEFLKEDNIPFTLVYPHISCKPAYLKRYSDRGDSAEFINLVNENWDDWIEQMEEAYESELCEDRIVLGNDGYLLEVIAGRDHLETLK